MPVTQTKHPRTCWDPTHGPDRLGARRAHLPIFSTPDGGCHVSINFLVIEIEL